MTIAEVAKKYGFTTDTLRYYERVGLLPNVRRTPGGIRDYSEEDCGWVEFIKCFRNAGVSIEALAEYIRLFNEGVETIPKRKALLEGQRDLILGRIGELTVALNRLNAKLDGYEERMLKREEKQK